MEEFPYTISNQMYLESDYMIIVLHYCTVIVLYSVLLQKKDMQEICTTACERHASGDKVGTLHKYCLNSEIQ